MVGVFFHTLFHLHRSHTYYYANEKGRCWLYACHDCNRAVTTVCAAHPGMEINFALKVKNEQDEKIFKNQTKKAETEKEKTEDGRHK